MIGALFHPGGRLEAHQFWSAFFFLMIFGGVMALIQQERPDLANLAVWGGLLAKVPFFNVFAQRFRAKGQPAAFALIPLGAGLAMAFLVSVVAYTANMMPVMVELAQERGFDQSTYLDVLEMLQLDADFRQAFEDRIVEPDVAARLVSQSAGPNLAGFWVPAFVLALWAGAPANRRV